MFSVLAPLIAAILQAGSSTLDKITLNIGHISHKTYLAISFPILFLVDIVAWLIFRPPLNFSMFAGRTGLFLFLSISIAIGTNILYYRALKKDRLSELNTFGLMAQIPVIIILAWFFDNERNLSHVIPALVAAGILVWAHWEHGKVRIARDTLPFLVLMLISAPLLAIMSKEILTVWSPVSLELLRDGAISLVIYPLYRASTHHIPKRGWRLLIITNILSAVAWILFYVGYQNLGVVYTGLLFSLSPMLVYLSSLFLLKEKFEPKKLAAFIVVLVSIGVAQFIP